jgi:hypothetical protein
MFWGFRPTPLRRGLTVFFATIFRAPIKAIVFPEFYRSGIFFNFFNFFKFSLDRPRNLCENIRRYEQSYVIQRGKSTAFRHFGSSFFGRLFRRRSFSSRQEGSHREGKGKSKNGILDPR